MKERSIFDNSDGVLSESGDQIIWVKPEDQILELWERYAVENFVVFETIRCGCRYFQG